MHQSLKLLSDTTSYCCHFFSSALVKEYQADQKKGLVKHPRKINRTYAYWSTKGILIGMFIKRLVRSALAAFDKQVEANTEIVRTGKRNARPWKPPRHYYMNYKDV